MRTKENSKRIVLTGCTRGLGHAMAHYFASKGHVVLGCGRSTEAIRALQKNFGDPHHFATVNVSDDAEVRRWAEKILTLGDAPDLLVNNAAVIAPNAPLWKVSDEDFGRVVDVNIKGVANVIRRFVPFMIERGHGIIVNFSSVGVAALLRKWRRIVRANGPSKD